MENKRNHSPPVDLTPPRSSTCRSTRISRPAQLLSNAQLEERCSSVRRHLRLIQLNSNVPEEMVPSKRSRRMDDLRHVSNQFTYPQIIMDHFIPDSLIKHCDDQSFTISETILKEKFNKLIEKKAS